MKTLVLTAVLALTAVSGVVVTAQPVAAQMINNDTIRRAFPGNPPKTTPPTKNYAAPARPSAGPGVRTRGPAEDVKSVCDVAPPCPSGCVADAASNKCTEWQGP